MTTDNSNSELTTPIRINSDLLWADEVIGQATNIIMKRFDVDDARALEVLRRMSQNTATQMCVIAQQVIEHHVPAEAVRHVEDVLGFS